jgi:hypothetical protein
VAVPDPVPEADERKPDPGSCGGGGFADAGAGDVLVFITGDRLKLHVSRACERKRTHHVLGKLLGK